MTAAVDRDGDRVGAWTFIDLSRPAMARLYTGQDTAAAVDRVGFSGTRAGMTQVQREVVLDLIRGGTYDLGGEVELHVGMCSGADEEVTDFLPLRVDVVGHPGKPEGHALRATSTVREYVKVHPVRHPLDRNRDIVDATDRLVAAPGPNSRGTWHTVRYAMSEGKHVDIVHPDGGVETFTPSEAGA